MSRENWSYIDAESYCTKVTDGTHDSPKSKDFGKPLITSKHIKGRNIDFENAYLISEEDYKKANQRSKVDQWDVLISMIGEYCGFCYVERSKEINYAVKNVGIYKTGSKLKAEWLYYYLNSSEGKKQLLSSRSGSSQPYITLGALRSFQILFPNSEKEAQGIINILSALDAKIELNARINAELDFVAKTLYDYWFVQFAPHKSAGGKMVWNEALKREIPLGWEVKSLGDFVDIFDSKRIPLSSSQRAKMQGQYPYYGATSIMDYVNDYIFDGEYLLIAEDGSVMGDDGLAIVQYIWGKTWVNNHAHVLLPKDPSNKDYLYFLLKSISVVQIMTGSIQKKITQDNLLGVQFALPDKETLKLFSEFARPIRQRIFNLTEESQTLTELRDWLLPMLMNGQVKV